MFQRLFKSTLIFPNLTYNIEVRFYPASWAEWDKLLKNLVSLKLTWRFFVLHPILLVTIFRVKAIWIFYLSIYVYGEKILYKFPWVKTHLLDCRLDPGSSMKSRWRYSHINRSLFREVYWNALNLSFTYLYDFEEKFGADNCKKSFGNPLQQYTMWSSDSYPTSRRDKPNISSATFSNKKCGRLVVRASWKS